MPLKAVEIRLAAGNSIRKLLSECNTGQQHVLKS
jgi:hypothetical protein